MNSFDTEEKRRFINDIVAFVRYHPQYGKYVHRLEHTQISGYSFQNKSEQHELFESLYLLGSDINIKFSKAHLKTHLNY